MAIATQTQLENLETSRRLSLADNLDEAPADQEVLRSNDPESAHLENASFLHKLIIGVTVFGPMAALILAIIVTWQFGFMGGIYLAVLIGGMMITGMGITIGYHRLLTHRSFETYAPIKALWMFLGAFAVEGSPLAWCAVHRKHHRHSDHEGDPHSPHLHDGNWKNVIKGFFHSHFGWLFKQAWSDELIEKYVPDLAAQPLMRFMHKHYGLIALATFALPGAITGLITLSWSGFWLGVLWGGVIRMFLNHHITWSINSICHIFGSKDFDSNDDSRNNVVMGILAWGEGWHNNHHAFPTSARHGLKWWQFDLSWLVIRGMQMCGLVWNVKIPSKRAINQKLIESTATETTPSRSAA